MNRVLANLWAKTPKSGATGWHPLMLHMLDVAASADAILAREPKSTRIRMAAIFGMTWEEARAWLLLVVACHDLGKTCPGFQCKWPEVLALTRLRLPRSVPRACGDEPVAIYTLAKSRPSCGTGARLTI